MSVSDDQIAHALELFDGVAPLTTRKMLEGMGCTRWTYTRDRGAKAGGPTGMPYWTLPDSAQDDPTAASALARRALTFL